MNEVKRDLISLGVLAIILFVAGTASYFAFRKDEERHKRLAAEVPANISNVYARRSVNPISGAEGIIDISVSYKYAIDGKEYERMIRLGKSASNLYREGQPAKVCYNPKKHDEAELFPTGYKCGD